MSETPSKLKRPEQFFEKATKSSLIEDVTNDFRKEIENAELQNEEVAVQQNASHPRATSGNATNKDRKGGSSQEASGRLRQGRQPSRSKSHRAMSNNDKIQRAVLHGEYVGNVAPLLANEIRRLRLINTELLEELQAVVAKATENALI